MADGGGCKLDSRSISPRYSVIRDLMIERAHLLPAELLNGKQKPGPQFYDSVWYNIVRASMSLLHYLAGVINFYTCVYNMSVGIIHSAYMCKCINISLYIIYLYLCLIHLQLYKHVDVYNVCIFIHR